MSTVALEKACGWQRKNHEDGILMHFILNDLSNCGHIQQELCLLIGLEKILDQDTHSFHLPLGEMSVTLLAVNKI